MNTMRALVFCGLASLVVCLPLSHDNLHETVSDKAANLGNPEELSNPNDPANKYHGGVHRVVIVNETENGTLPGGFPFPKPPEGGRPFRVYHHLPLEGRHPFRFHHHLPKPRGGINSFWVYHRLPKHHGGGPVKVYHHYPKRRRNANRH